MGPQSQQPGGPATLKRESTPDVIDLDATMSKVSARDLEFCEFDMIPAFYVTTTTPYLYPFLYPLLFYPWYKLSCQLPILIC